jgi:hypothetical protein
MYGLPQAGILANKLLPKRLGRHGYFEQWVDIAMPVYAIKNLTRYNHPPPLKPQNCPYTPNNTINHQHQETPVHYLTPPANDAYNKLLVVSYTTHERLTLPFSWHYQQSPHNKVPLLKRHSLLSTNSSTTCGHTPMQKSDTELPT